MYIVYILQSGRTHRYYIGSTMNLTDRLGRHNSGRNVSTQSGRPWHIVHTETYTSLREAHTRERQLKSFHGGEAFKKIFR